MSSSGRVLYTEKEFFMEDIPRTLFPLSTNRVLIEHGSDKVLEFAQSLAGGEGSFLPQRRVHANKDHIHLRRTVKLDVVAEYYLYHIVHKNRNKFRKPHVDGRVHFGYRFDNGRPVSPSKSYADFKSTIGEYNIMSEEFISFDIANYFNNVYHHDLHAWFSALCPDDTNDVVAFGKFFREINAGRSLDCLPQGLYPSKMVGNDFLRFIENSSSIRSKKILRFMDDVYIFGDDLSALKADFAEIQRILGLKGLSVNASKTHFSGMPFPDQADEQISELKKRLLKRRRNIIISKYMDDDKDIRLNPPLEESEIEFAVSLLNSKNISDDDAELILIVMRDNVDRIEEYLEYFAMEFPNLAKNFYGLCKEAADMEVVARIILDTLSDDYYIDEYQLFWFGVMLDDYLMDTSCASDIINKLFNNKYATDITKAKLLEIADHRHGLPEMREVFLREGRSDWLAWASAVGSRKMSKQSRNYLLDYFKNGSSMNRLIAGIVRDIENPGD